MPRSRGACGAFNQCSHVRLLSRCQTRGFRVCPILQSGHNRWSKIKHDKGKNDALKHRQRSIFSQEIATASKISGPDPNANPRLADLITKAKREGFAKASIESAIARGQGRSLSGASLESVVVEGMLPNNIGVIVDCETDNKLRTLSDVRLVIKHHGGTATPTSYLFEKKGKITLESKEGLGIDNILEPALEAGAEDIAEDEEGRVVIITEPQDVQAVGEAITTHGLEIATSRVVWDPRDDLKVGITSDAIADDIKKFLDELQEKESTLQAVAINVSQGDLSTDTWRDLKAQISS